MPMFRSLPVAPVTLEVRDWDGSLAAGLDLVSWVKDNGGQANVNANGGRATISLWQPATRGVVTFIPERDYLVRDEAGTFHVVPQSVILAEYQQVD